MLLQFTNLNRASVLFGKANGFDLKTISFSNNIVLFLTPKKLKGFKTQSYFCLSIIMVSNSEFTASTNALEASSLLYPKLEAITLPLNKFPQTSLQYADKWKIKDSIKKTFLKEKSFNPIIIPLGDKIKYKIIYFYIFDLINLLTPYQQFMNNLNLAIILENTLVENWIYMLLEKIIQDKNITLSSFIVHQENKKRKSVVLKLYTALEKKILRLENDALSKREIRSLCGINIIETKEGTAALETISYDLILNLTNKDVSTKFLKLSKLGVWSFYPGNYMSHRSDFPELTEWLSKDYECGITLLSLKQSESTYSIVDYAILPNDLSSFVRCVNLKYFQSIPLILRNIKRINDSGIKDSSFPLSNYSDKHIRVNDIGIIKRLVFGVFKTIKNNLYRFSHFNQWVLMFQLNSHTKSDLDFNDFIEMIPPKDRFWADPFVVFRNNTYYIFVEELIYKNKIGHLSVIEMDINGNYSKPSPILIKPYHLSYPFIIEDDNDIYMIPETSQNKTIELYKCVNFPLEWKFVKNIMTNVVAVDTTIYKRDGQYWLFTNLREQNGGSKHIELNLFTSKDILSDDWVSHPNNPIVKNVSKARPAGNLFSVDDELYRPSQDCSKHYGYAISINKIGQMTSNVYEEELVSKIKPQLNSRIISTHTINYNNDLVIIDAMMKMKK